MDSLASLTEEQVDYIFSHVSAPSYLEACPGSGKTEVIGWKAAYEFAKWKPRHAGIAITTFTNSAANELVQRVKKHGGENCISFPHFVGTFDSWLHSYVMQPFAADIVGYLGKEGDKSFQIIDTGSYAPFLNAFTSVITYKGNNLPITAVEYYYDADKRIQSIDADKQTIFDSLSVKDKKYLKETKIKFFKHGFCTYADAETLVRIVMQKKPTLLALLAKRFPVILIDECQDLSASQISILEMIRSAGSALHFIGDLNQSIYEFRKVDPLQTKAYIHNLRCRNYQLTQNFRSCQPIVNIVQSIIGHKNIIQGRQEQMVDRPCVILPYTDKTFDQLPARYEEIIARYRLNPSKCAIIARGKTTLEGLQNGKEYFNLKIVELFANALGYWFKEQRSTYDLHNALLFLGRAFSFLIYGGRGNSRNYYCPEKIDHVQWRLCLSRFFNELAELYLFINGQHADNWTKWVARLKSLLEVCWKDLPNNNVQWDDAKNRLRSPIGRKEELVKLSLTIPKKKEKIRATTIHNVKGETLEAVLLISHKDKKSPGGHFSHWLTRNNPEPEYLRFAYVACSRPKHLLVLAMNMQHEKDVKDFLDIGFQLYQ